MTAAAHQWGVEAHKQILQPIAPNEWHEDDVEGEAQRQEDHYRHHLQHLLTSEIGQQQQGDRHGKAYARSGPGEDGRAAATRASSSPTRKEGALR